jgi:hypothetical protein
MTASLGVDDALNYILQRLRSQGPAEHGQHGYHATVVDLASRYVAEVIGSRHPDPIENEDTYAVSIAIYDAAWELARRGIVRPSVHNSFMQFDAFNAAGGGFTLTTIGAEWLAGLGERRLSVRDRWGPFDEA